MQAEDDLGRECSGAHGASAFDLLLERLGALVQRAPEALLLGREPHVDHVRLIEQFGVGGAHQLADPLPVADQEPGGELEHASLVDRAAHHPPQDVAAVLVRGHHPVGDQERAGAGVVGQDPQRAVAREVRPVARPGQLLAEFDQRHELVGLEHRRLVLQDRGHAVQAHARVDVVRRQRLQLAPLPFWAGAGRTA